MGVTRSFSTSEPLSICTQPGRRPAAPRRLSTPSVLQEQRVVDRGGDDVRAVGQQQVQGPGALGRGRAGRRRSGLRRALRRRRAVEDEREHHLAVGVAFDARAPAAVSACDRSSSPKPSAEVRDEAVEREHPVVGDERCDVVDLDRPNPAWRTAPRRARPSRARSPVKLVSSHIVVADR